jgi:hypothetical protein
MTPDEAEGLVAWLFSIIPPWLRKAIVVPLFLPVFACLAAGVLVGFFWTGFKAGLVKSGYTLDGLWRWAFPPKPIEGMGFAYTAGPRPISPEDQSS